MHAIKDKPVVVNRQIVVRSSMVGKPSIDLVSKSTYVAMKCDINTLCVYISCQGIQQGPSQNALGPMKTVIVGPEQDH